MVLHLIAKGKLNDQVEQVKEALSLLKALIACYLMDDKNNCRRDRTGSDLLRLVI